MSGIYAKYHVQIMLLGTLRSNDADWQRERQKTMGLISKTTSHVHHAFFLFFFPVFARLRRGNP